MANSAQARKRARQAETRRQRNAAQRSMMRTAVKKVLKALATKDKTEAQSAFAQAAPLLDRMAGKGLIHKNTAARHKRRLNAHIRGL